MRYEKEQATKLRLQGKSYSQITDLLKVPKSTLSGWLQNIVLSESSQEKISLRAKKKSTEALIKKNKQQTHLAQQRAQSTRLQAAIEVGKLSKRELFLIGTALYWAEGYKRPIVHNGKKRTYHPIKLSNSDPQLIVVFMEFLKQVCQVPESKISAGIRIYQHHNAQQLLQFWHKTTKIPLNKFHKFYYGVSKSSLGKRPFNILPYGTIQIVVNDTKLFHTIMGWIEGLSKNYI